MLITCRFHDFLTEELHQDRFDSPDRKSSPTRANHLSPEEDLSVALTSILPKCVLASGFGEFSVMEKNELKGRNPQRKKGML